jgi:hypothetical protein
MNRRSFFGGVLAAALCPWDAVWSRIEEWNSQTEHESWRKGFGLVDGVTKWTNYTMTYDPAAGNDLGRKVTMFYQDGVLSGNLEVMQGVPPDSV